MQEGGRGMTQHIRKESREESHDTLLSTHFFFYWFTSASYMLFFLYRNNYGTLLWQVQGIDVFMYIFRPLISLVIYSVWKLTNEIITY